MTRQRRKQRGVALIAVAVFLSALLALTAIGIDVGRLAHTATEVQTVADAAATAGVRALAATGGAPGTGITRARHVANMNIMNGEFAPNADVLVDEGYWGSEDRQFECCTSNTPCCQTGHWGDVHCVGAGNDCSKRTAVLAVPHTVVDNLFAGIFDFFRGGRISAVAATGSPNKTTRVEKLAIAAYQGPATGCGPVEGCAVDDYNCYCQHDVAPCLPIAAPSCRFPDPCTDEQCQLPSLSVANDNHDTAAWTGFQAGANANVVRSLFPDECASGPDRDIPPQDVFGSEVNVTNGINGRAAGQAFGAAKCVFDRHLGCRDSDGDGDFDGAGGEIFTIPIFDLPGGCGTPMNGTYDVVGFATIKITNVSLGGGGTQPHVDIVTLGHKAAGEVLGGDDLGTGNVALVH